MTLFTWSQTAASNNTADTSINWREGQAPSTVNNSSRAIMAAVAKYRDDMSGMLNTGGSSMAYTVTSNQGYTSLIDGMRVVARMHVANGAAPTMNVDGRGAKAINTHTSTAVPSGAMFAGGIYAFTYDSGDDCFYVGNFFAATDTDFADNTFFISDNGDDTKKLAFQLSGLTTANTRTLTVPDASGTIALTSDLVSASETVAGFVELATTAEVRSCATGDKALTAQDVEEASAQVTLTDASTIAVNWDSLITGTLTISSNRTLGNPTNAQPGTFRTVEVKSDGSDRTLAFDTNYRGLTTTITGINTGVGQRALITLYREATGASHVVVCGVVRY